MIYSITNKISGADLGSYDAESPIAAIVAMQADAGYDVALVDGAPLYGDRETMRICGPLSDLIVTEEG